MDTEIGILRELLEELRKDVGFLKEMYKVNEIVDEKQKGICQGITGKGTACKNGAVEFTHFCQMHNAQ